MLYLGTKVTSIAFPGIDEARLCSRVVEILAPKSIRLAWQLSGSGKLPAGCQCCLLRCGWTCAGEGGPICRQLCYPTAAPGHAQQNWKQKAAIFFKIDRRQSSTASSSSPHHEAPNPIPALPSRAICPFPPNAYLIPAKPPPQCHSEAKLRPSSSSGKVVSTPPWPLGNPPKLLELTKCPFRASRNRCLPGSGSDPVQHRRLHRRAGHDKADSRSLWR